MAERQQVRVAKLETGARFSPLNQVRASEVEGASKYNMALLSTRRRAIYWSLKSRLPVRIIALLTIAMDDACRLRKCLHTKDCP